MPRLILHVGMPKCGSSAIQHYLASLDNRHRALGVCYPQVYRTPGGYRNHKPLVGLKGTDLTDAVERISQEVSAIPDCRIVIVSAEDWCLKSLLKSAREFCHHFCERNPAYQAEVVAYFRNPFTYIESCFAQMITGGLLHVNISRFFTETDGTIDDFVRVASQRQSYPIVSIAAAADLIRSSLGKIPVSFRSIESEDAVGGGLLPDLCSLIDVPVDERLSGSRRNTRKTLRQIVALKRARSVMSYQEFMSLRQLILHHPACQTDDGPKRLNGIHVGAQLAATIREAIEADKSKLEGMFAVGVSGLCRDQWLPIDCDSVMDETEADSIIAEVRELGRELISA